MNKYLVYLEGGGDHYWLIVGKAAIDWINSPRPEFDDSHYFEEPVPEAVRAECYPTMEPVCHVTTGSCENDRALHLLEGYKIHSVFPKRIAFEGSWEGYVY